MPSTSTTFLLVLFSLLLVPHPSVSLSTASSSSNNNSNSYNNRILLSRLQNTQCELLLSIGRIPGTAMPSEWAASGAKLGFPLEIEFTSDPCEYEMTKERLLKGDALMGTSLYAVNPLNEPTFISRNGMETIKVTPGAFGCRIQGLANKQYALRFFLDFPEGAVRNDVELPAERIYFLSSCWLFEDEGVLERARRRKETLETTIEEVTLELEDKDRAMSKQGFFQKAVTFRESIQLVERKGKLRSELYDLEQKYPLDDSKIIRGPNNIIFAKEGFVAVKRFRGALGTREQYHWVGTFSYNEFFDDEEKESDE